MEATRLRLLSRVLVGVAGVLVAAGAVLLLSRPGAGSPMNGWGLATLTVLVATSWISAGRSQPAPWRDDGRLVLWALGLAGLLVASTIWVFTLV
ncbi:MAG: hypothetical protein AAGD14_02840 [Planctomycetota bacterium]